MDRSIQPPPPPVWNWYVAYCVLMAILYLLVVVVGFVFLFMDPADLDSDPMQAKIMAFIFIGVGLPLLVPYAIAPFLPRRSWVWIFDLVLICIGLTSACCLPAAIPLLIFWLKPETKVYFGREPTA
jgi:hypothetical protein